MENNRKTGYLYEERAAAFLKEQGYDILERNFYSKYGELDIIARDGAYIVFVEVKYRKSMRRGQPWEAVDLKKQRHIIRTAQYYMKSNQFSQGTPCRFDVVSILGHTLTLYKNAFTL